MAVPAAAVLVTKEPVAQAAKTAETAAQAMTAPTTSRAAVLVRGQTPMSSAKLAAHFMQAAVVAAANTMEALLALEATAAVARADTNLTMCLLAEQMVKQTLAAALAVVLHGTLDALAAAASQSSATPVQHKEGCN